MATERAPRWRRITRRRVLIAASLLGLLLVLALAVIARGGVETYAGPQRAAGSPAWTAPCWTRPPRADRRLLSRCARVEGTVIWGRREGQGPTAKAHLVLVSDFGLVLARFNPVPAELPGIGSFVTVTGPLVRARNGMREVQAFGLS